MASLDILASWRPHRLVVAVLLVVVAASARVWPLGGLGPILVWLTFYPAVMIAGIYGGFAAGMLAMLLACLVGRFLGPLLVGQPFIATTADWIGMVVFIFNGTMISGVTEAMLRARKRAREAQEQAERANRAKSIFLANMSHELRTPLNSILGFSRLLRADPDLGAERLQSVEIIVRSGEHLLNLVNNVLDISKIEAGRVELEEALVDLHHLLREVHALLQVQAVARGLALGLDIAPATPQYVVVDAGKLRQVLTNLVGNAIKFTAQGHVVLRAEATAGDVGTDAVRVRFAIADTGVGIAREDQARLFTPFVRVGATGEAGRSGTGLGLAISRQFVELMHGTLQVHSSPGLGSEFFFELPLRRAAAPNLAAGSDGGRVIGLEPGEPVRRVLVAEDQAENRLLLHRLLDPLGFELRDAANGQEAVELCAAWHPDLIFMDVRMPVLDGREATRRIRASAAASATVPIVALTAHALEDERLEILAAGCTDFVRKPYRESEIYDALRRHLGVRFRHAGPVATAEASGAADAAGGPGEALERTQLARLPLARRAALRDAVVELDAGRCREVAMRVGERDPALGRALLRQIDALRFRELLDLLEESPAESPPR